MNPRTAADYARMAEDPFVMHEELVELRRKKLAVESEIDRRLMRDSRWERYMDDMRNTMVLRMRHDIYGIDHPNRHVVSYPADWWQAVKERFAPAWFRDRYPVKFTEVVAGLEELYPEIRPVLPDHEPVMRVRVMRRDDYPAW